MTLTAAEKFRTRSLTRRTVFVCVLLLTLALAPCATYAQPAPGPGPGPRLRRGGFLPSERYYSGRALIEAGQFANAVRFYEQELRGAVKIAGSLWIDSICYNAMLGETYYQAGNYDEALKRFDSALTIAMAYSNWPSKVQYTSVPTHNAKGASPWGVSRRNCPLGVFPSKATIIVGEGETDASRQLGINVEQQAYSIDPVEILRCIALSLRRRVDIMGPLSPYDKMSSEILDSFRTRTVAPNHWSVVFFDVIWGIALIESDKTTAGVKTLNDSLMALGQFDHNLTATALIELGHVFLKTNKIREAAECYYESAQSAYQYGDQLLLEEALRLYSNCVKGMRGGTVDPALAGAYRWAKSQRGQTLLQTSLGLELVEGMIYSGKLAQAKSGLSALETTMRGEVRQTIHADRWNYLNALVNYAAGETRRGDEALALVVEGAKVRSTWARQLGKLDAYVARGLTANGELTPRNAADLYEYLLREPTVVDWAVNPTESLSIQMIAPLAAYERQFQLLFARDLKDKAFEVAERIRRERFFSTQTYGGRLISLRYILTADDALLTSSMRAARETLNMAYPDFEASMKATSEVMERLNAIPSVPADRDSAKRQESLFAELSKISGSQEAMLHFIAAGRVRIPYVFPPVYAVEEVQKRLQPDTAILSFIQAGPDTFGFMIGKENLDAWRIGGSAEVSEAIATFLKTIGNADGSRYVEAEKLGDDLWKAQGSKLREIVLGATDVDADRFNIVFSNLVVVPDGALWYLPFEALCLPKIASSAEEEEEEEVVDVVSGKDVTTDAAATENVEDDADEDDAEEKETRRREAQYDDLDSAYYDGDADDELDDDELFDDPAADAADAEEEEESPVVDEDSDDEEDDEEIVVATPQKRKSSAARKREALQAYEDSLMPMISAPDFTIRYSATVSLALPNAIGRNAFVATTLVASATYPREPAERVSAAVKRFSAAVPKTEATTASAMTAIPGNLYSARLRRLVVWEEIVADTWNWAPVVLGNKPRPGNTVSAWIEAPWGAPRLIVIPALRTPAENSLKNGGDGSELALAVLAMQAGGADTMLLSRWRTGGRSAYDLSQDFVKNYENEPAAVAWKKAATALMKRDVIPEEEPRLKKLGRSESIPKYTAPFWWAGYMLVDSGEAVAEDKLDEFDEDAARKAEEENELLKNDEKNGAAPAADDDFDLDAADDDEGERAVFTTPKNDDATPFNIEPRTLTDDDLAQQDAEGDDFFARDDEPAPSVKDDPDPKEDDSDAPATSGAAAKPNAKGSSGSQTAPATTPSKSATPKTSTSNEKDAAPTKGSGNSGSGSSSGRLSIKGKGGKS